MLERLAQLARNAGIGGGLRLLVAAAAAMGFGLVMPFVREGYWPVALGFAGGIVVPWLFRRLVIDRVDRFQAVHRYLGYTIVGTSVLLRAQLKAAGPAVAAAAVAVLAAYLSAYVLVLSDPQVTVIARR
jgi:hypothetical protein